MRHISGLICATILASAFPCLAQPIQQFPSVISRYDHNNAGWDEEAAGMTMDAAGNIYITGWTNSPGRSNPSERVSLTVKFNRSGALQWSASEEGIAPGAIAADGQGGVVTGGRRYDVRGHSFFHTVKYGNTGQPLWVAEYGDELNYYNQPRAVAADAAGNSYVTGASDSGHGIDFNTIKYTPEGQIAWAVRYGASGEISWNVPTCIAVSNEGDVYVAGTSNAGGAVFYDVFTPASGDLVLIKYSPDGQEQWKAFYTDPNDGGTGAVALAIAPDGGIVIVGGIGSTGDESNAGMDYLTIKYSSDGTQIWAVRYDGDYHGKDVPADLAVSLAGNIYVTGTSMGSSGTEIASVGYRPDGTIFWARRYAEVPWLKAAGIGVSRDQWERVYITASLNFWEALQAGGIPSSEAGSSRAGEWLTIVYSPASTEDVAWVGRYPLGDAVGIAVDMDGNAFVAGTSRGLFNAEPTQVISSDFTLIGYISSKNELFQEPCPACPEPTCDYTSEPYEVIDPGLAPPSLCGLLPISVPACILVGLCLLRLQLSSKRSRGLN